MRPIRSLRPLVAFKTAEPARQRRERLGVVVLADEQRTGLGVGPLHRGHVRGRRQVVDDRVENRLYAPVAQRSAAQNGHEDPSHRPLAQRKVDLCLGDVLLLEVLVHDRVVEVRDCLDEVVPVLADEVLHSGRDLERLGVGGAEIVRVDDRLLRDQVDVALERALRPDRQLDRDRARAQARSNRPKRAVEVRPDPVHLVDEGDARHAVAVGLAPDRFGLRFHTRDGIEHRHRAVQHTKRPLDFHREVHVPGCVYDVDRVLAPVGGRCRRRDRDPPLLLLDHPVHGRRPFVDLAHLVDAPCIEKDAFGGRGLTGVDVRHDPDVPDLVDCDRTLLHLQCQAHLSISTGSGRKPCCFPPSDGFLPSA